MRGEERREASPSFRSGAFSFSFSSLLHLLHSLSLSLRHSPHVHTHTHICTSGVQHIHKLAMRCNETRSDAMRCARRQAGRQLHVQSADFRPGARSAHGACGSRPQAPNEFRFGLIREPIIERLHNYPARRSAPAESRVEVDSSGAQVPHQRGAAPLLHSRFRR